MDNKFKNLQHLIDSIDLGLDIEFDLYNKPYNISIGDDDTRFITLCPNGDTKHYKNGKDMVDNYNIDGKLLKDLWKDVQIANM